MNLCAITVIAKNGNRRRNIKMNKYLEKIAMFFRAPRQGKNFGKLPFEDNLKTTGKIALGVGAIGLGAAALAKKKKKKAG